ncbi:MAG: VOC family protein [Alphaproteobacteria bacterium]
MLAENRKTAANAATNAILPYLFFNGRCEEAVNFYKKALGGEIEMLMRWKDNPDLPKDGCAPGMPFDPQKIMHATLKVGDAILMASDGMPQEKSGFQGFSVSLTARNDGECDRWFNALAEGGQVQMPLGKTFFAQRFGAVADRFGVSWMIIVPPSQA